MAAFAEILGMEHDGEQALARARQDDSGKRSGLVEVVALPEQAGNAGPFHDLVGLLVVRQALERIQHVKFLELLEGVLRNPKARSGTLHTVFAPATVS